MEPQANSTPSPENLPQPTPETGAEGGGIEQAPVPAAPEVDKPKESGSQNTGMPPVPVQTVPVAPPVVTDDDDDVTGVPVVGDTPAMADDIDVIEKEWVDKAKSIVDKNRQDPHVQNKEVSVLKADYMKKRYGKDIKLTKD